MVIMTTTSTTTTMTTTNHDDKMNKKGKDVDYKINNKDDSGGGVYEKKTSQ